MPNLELAAEAAQKALGGVAPNLSAKLAEAIPEVFGPGAHAAVAGDPQSLIELTGNLAHKMHNAGLVDGNPSDLWEAVADRGTATDAFSGRSHGGWSQQVVFEDGTKLSHTQAAGRSGALAQTTFTSADGSASITHDASNFFSGPRQTLEFQTPSFEGSTAPVSFAGPKTRSLSSVAGDLLYGSGTRQQVGARLAQFGVPLSERNLAYVLKTERFEPGFRLDNGALIHKTAKTSGAEIASGVVVGPDAVAARGSTVEEGALMERGTTLGRDSSLGPGGHLGYKSSVGAGSRIESDYLSSGPYADRYPATDVGHYTRIGNGVVIPAHTSVGDHVFMGDGVQIPDERFGYRVIPDHTTAQAGARYAPARVPEPDAVFADIRRKAGK